MKPMQYHIIANLLADSVTLWKLSSYWFKDLQQSHAMFMVDRAQNNPTHPPQKSKAKQNKNALLCYCII